MEDQLEESNTTKNSQSVENLSQKEAEEKYVNGEISYEEFNRHLDRISDTNEIEFSEEKQDENVNRTIFKFKKPGLSTHPQMTGTVWLIAAVSSLMTSILFISDGLMVSGITFLLTSSMQFGLSGFHLHQAYLDD